MEEPVRIDGLFGFFRVFVIALKTAPTAETEFAGDIGRNGFSGLRIHNLDLDAGPGFAVGKLADIFILLIRPCGHTGSLRKPIMRRNEFDIWEYFFSTLIPLRPCREHDEFYGTEIGFGVKRTGG